jgi:hypothetical protein
MWDLSSKCIERLQRETNIYQPKATKTKEGSVIKSSGVVPRN